jgi:hypothetical protein
MRDYNYEDRKTIETENLARKKHRETVQRLETVIVDLGITSTSGDDVLDGWLDSSALSFLGGAKPASSTDLEDKKIQRIIAIALTQYGFSNELQTDLTELCLGDPCIEL